MEVQNIIILTYYTVGLVYFISLHYFNTNIKQIGKNIIFNRTDPLLERFL